MLTNGADCVVEVRPTRVDNYSHTYLYYTLYYICITCQPVCYRADNYSLTYLYYTVLYLYYVPAGMLPGWSSYFAVLCDQPVLLKVTRIFLYYLIGVT